MPARISRLGREGLREGLRGALRIAQESPSFPDEFVFHEQEFSLFHFFLPSVPLEAPGHEFSPFHFFLLPSVHLEAPGHELMRRFRHQNSAQLFELFADLFELPQARARQGYFAVECRCQNFVAQVF